MIDWMLMPLKRYAVFRGRSQRAEYWWFTLGLMLAGVVSGVVDALVFRIGSDSMGPAQGLLVLATLLPGLAVTVRRLHDIGRSGWWLLVVLVPLVGTLVLLWWTVQDGQAGPNRFGPDPKGARPPTLESLYGA